MTSRGTAPLTRIKPMRGNFDPALAAPEWRWVWQGGHFIGAWMFGEGGGLRTRDFSLNRHDGSFQGTDPNLPTWTTPKLRGPSVEFSSEQEWINVADTDRLDCTDGRITILTRIYPRSFGESGNGRIIDKGGGSGPSGYALLLNNGGGADTLHYSVNDATASNGDSNIITLNAWNDVILIQDVGDVSFFVDQKAAGTATGFQTPTAGTIDVRLGARNDNFRAFDGFIDYVYLFDTALPIDAAFELSVTPFGPFHRARRRKAAVAVGGRIPSPLVVNRAPMRASLF